MDQDLQAEWKSNLQERLLVGTPEELYHVLSQGLLLSYVVLARLRLPIKNRNCQKVQRFLPITCFSGKIIGLCFAADVGWKNWKKKPFLPKI